MLLHVRDKGLDMQAQPNNAAVRVPPAAHGTHVPLLGPHAASVPCDATGHPHSTHTDRPSAVKGGSRCLNHRINDGRPCSRTTATVLRNSIRTTRPVRRRITQKAALMNEPWTVLLEYAARYVTLTNRAFKLVLAADSMQRGREPSPRRWNTSPCAPLTCGSPPIEASDAGSGDDAGGACGARDVYLANVVAHRVVLSASSKARGHTQCCATFPGPWPT
eukprot:3797495-Prymnesium_polylepis.1